MSEPGLLVFPVLLGTGKRFFSDGTLPGELALVAAKAASSAVIISTYRPKGPLRTGSFDDKTSAHVREAGGFMEMMALSQSERLQQPQPNLTDRGISWHGMPKSIEGYGSDNRDG